VCKPRLGGPAINQPFSSPIPWRRPGVKHSSAEIFFDFAESLALTLDRKGAVVRDERWGELECNARLSGVPEISLHLGGGAIKGQGLHPCVRCGASPVQRTPPAQLS
jgi:AP-3 complex subunit mu